MSQTRERLRTHLQPEHSFQLVWLGMEQGLQSLAPGRPLVSRTVLGRAALPHGGTLTRNDWLKCTGEQHYIRLCTQASSAVGVGGLQGSFSAEGSRSLQRHAPSKRSQGLASLMRDSLRQEVTPSMLKFLPQTSVSAITRTVMLHREGSEASPSSSTSSNDETSSKTFLSAL